MGLILEAENIWKSYNNGHIKTEVLKGVDIMVNQGDIIVILGRSGSGKSTFLNILGGIDIPDKGRVIIENENLQEKKESNLAEMRNSKIGFIFQNYNLIHELTVLENIRLPFDIAGKRYDKEYEEYLIQLLQLDDRLKFYPSQLSGGEQQRAGILRALLYKPSLILADEPTGNLDEKASEDIINYIKNANDNLKQTFVIVTHDNRWKKIANRVFNMNDGELYEEVLYND